MANGGKEEDPFPDLSALRYIAEADDSVNSRKLLEDFKESDLAEGINAKSDLEFARKAEQKAIDVVGEKFDTSMPATRVALGAPPDVPDDKLWNDFQESSLSKRFTDPDTASVDSFFRERIVPEQSSSLQGLDPEFEVSEETSIPKTRELLDVGEDVEDEELISSFKESVAFDPNSDLDAASQAELFAQKNLYGKVNSEIEKTSTQALNQGNYDFTNNPEDKDRSWTAMLMDFFTPEEEEEETAVEDAPAESEIPGITGSILSEFTGETGTPFEQISKALGNEDVETGSSVADEIARTLDVPFSLARFAREEAVRFTGTALDAADYISEEVSDSFYDSDAPDVPGIPDGEVTDSMLDPETGEVKSSSELIKEASSTSNQEEKSALFRAAAMQRRKKRYENLSFTDKANRWVNQLGRGFVSALAGAPRQVGAAMHKIEQQIDPDPKEELEDNTIVDITNATEEFIHNRAMPVDKDFSGGFWGDMLPQAFGSMGGFVIGSKATAGVARRAFRPIRRDITVGRGVTGGPIQRSAGRVDDLGSDEVANIVSSNSVATRSISASDELTQTGARSLIARNADDVEKALTVGGANKFKSPDELTRADQNMIGATKIMPGIQGGGMAGYDAYERTKQIPDPSIYPKEIQELIQKRRSGESLNMTERQKLDSAVESRAMEAFWTAAPGGWSEAVAGRVIDTWVRSAAGTQRGTLINALEGAGTEFTQESLASAYIESANKAINNPEIEPLDKMFEEGMAGALAGALMQGTAAAAGRMESSQAQLERLGVEDGRVAEEELGVNRGQEHQKQRAREIQQDDEARLDPQTFARSISDIERDGSASRVFNLTKSESDQVRALVNSDEIESGNLEVYAEEPELRRQDRVARSMSAIIDGIDEFSEQDRQALKDRIHFHDVHSRTLTPSEREKLDVEGVSDASFAGVTHPNVFDNDHFNESHIFADASRVDAFEEFFHSLYDSSSQDTKQRLVEAYNQTEDENIESYEEGREDISRRFAEELEAQADIDPATKMEGIRRGFNNIIDSLSPDNPIQKEVKDLLSGQVDLGWNGPISMEERTLVVSQPTTTHIDGADGTRKDEPLGVFQSETINVLERQLDDIDSDKEPAWVLKPDPAQAARTGVGRESLIEAMEEVHAEFREDADAVVEEVEAEIETETEGQRQAADAAQETETSEGLPSVDMPKAQIESLGFRHENHAVNAVNRDRREKGMPEYEEGETVPKEEIINSAQKPERVDRRIEETGRVPPSVSVRTTPTSSVTSLDENALREEERRVRAWVRDAEVIDGREQALISRAQKRIRQEREAAERLEEEGNYLKAEKKRRFADAVERGLNDRVQKNPVPGSESDTQIEAKGYPQEIESNARIPTWAESVYIPQLQKTYVWDPSKPDPTGARDAIRQLPSISLQTQSQQDEDSGSVVDQADGNIRVVGTNKAQNIGLSRGKVVRVQGEPITEEIEGLGQVEFIQLAGESAEQTEGDPLTDDREGTWVRVSDLVGPRDFVDQLQEQREIAQQNQQTGRVSRINETLQSIRQELTRLSDQQSTEEQVDLSEIERVDPSEVSQRTPMGQLIFDLARARDHALVGDDGRALHLLRDARRRASSNDDLNVNLFSLDAAENDGVQSLRAAQLAQNIEEIVNGERSEIETPDEAIPVENRGQLEDALVQLGIDPEEAEVTSEVFDARAEAFSSQTGLSKSDWYKTRIESVGRADLSDDALNQIRLFHGTPYYFTKFDSQFIGEGEENQAFGWGLYFTGSESVARHHYADKLAQEKGSVEWDFLGGRYTVSREVGESVLTIVGPDGNIVGTVSEESESFGLNPDKVADSLEKARKVVARDAIERDLDDAPESLALVEDRKRTAYEAERERFEAQERLAQNQRFQAVLEEITSHVNRVLDSKTLSSEDLIFDVLADMQRVGSEFDSIFQPSWESDLMLTLGSEFDLSTPRERELSALLSDESIQGQLREAAEETGYIEARQREIETTNRYEAARRQFRAEINVEIANIDRFLMEAVIHEGRSPEEYNYARWRDPLSAEDAGSFLNVVDSISNERVDEDASTDGGIWPTLKSALEARSEGRELDNVQLAAVGGAADGTPMTAGSVYNRIVQFTSLTQKEVSEALLENGVDGFVYRGSSGQGNYDNYVVFDDSEITTESVELFQKREGDVTGAIDFLNDGRAQISFFEGADADTVIEELGHLLLEDMPFEDQQIVADAVDDPNATPGDLTPEAHEQFSDWFRRYVREGEAPNTTLESIMAKISNLMEQVWNRIAPTDWATERIPAEVRATMDRLFRRGDPRAEIVENSSGGVESEFGGALKIEEDGTRFFYPEAYARWVYQSDENQAHAQLTPEEFAEYKKVGNPTQSHKSYTRQAIQSGEQVPEASKIEYIEDTPLEFAKAAEFMGAPNLEPDDIGNAEASETITETIPDDFDINSEVEGQTEVEGDGTLERELSEEELGLAGVMSGDFQNQSNVERAKQGKVIMPGSGGMVYVTPEMVQAKFDQALNGQDMQDRQELVQAVRSPEFMDAQEMREFREREQAFGRSNSQEARERYEATLDKINEVTGDDNPFDTLEGALRAIEQDILRSIRQANFYRKQLQVARSQEDYEASVDTEFHNNLRGQYPDGLTDEAEEALNEFDGESIESVRTRMDDKNLKNSSVDWRRQGEEFINPVEWFEEFWLSQSGRKKSDRNGIVGMVEEFSDQWFALDDAGLDYVDVENGQLVVTFDQSGEDIPNSRTRASYAWQSLSMKEAKGTLEDLNGGVAIVERDLFEEGIQDRAVLVTPNFAIEMRRMSNRNYKLIMRDPTDEELDITRTERDALRWQNRSLGQSRAITEAPANAYNDTFGPDEGDHTFEEKVSIFTTNRPTYDLDGEGLLVERTALEGRSNADGVKLSLLVDEAQGPVAIFYDQKSGDLEFATDDEFANQLREEYGDQVRDRVEEIRANDEGGPDLFGDEDVVSTESVSENTQDYVEGLREMLGIDNRIAIVDPSDVDPNDPGAFSGDHRAGRLIPHDASNELEEAATWVRDFGNGDYYIAIREDVASDAYLSEAIAHEVGHIIFDQRLSSERHAEARSRLREEHNKHLENVLDQEVGDFIEEFMSYHRLRSSEYLESVADLTMEELRERNPEMFRYLTSFEEWVAEQTSRYVTTEDATASDDPVVRRLYNELVSFFRDIYKFLMSNGFGPNVKFSEWMKHHVQEKETGDRVQQVTLATNGTPYQQEIAAREAIENARDTVPADVLSDIREAVQSNQDLSEIIEPLPDEIDEDASKYARAFSHVIRAQDRRFPRDASAYVNASYAVSAPTPATREERWSEVTQRWKDSKLNELRRSYYTNIHRRVTLLEDRYPILKQVTDQIFAPADRSPETTTFTEAQQQARNHFGSRLADILRRIKRAGVVQPSQEDSENWTRAGDRIDRVVELLESDQVNARNEESLRQIEEDDVLVQEAMNLREFLDDFFNYMVEKGALPENAKIENYFPQVLDQDAVLESPDAFEGMIFRQLKETAAEKADTPLREFQFSADARRKAEAMAKRVRKVITGVEQNKTVKQLLNQDGWQGFADRLGFSPSSVKARRLTFLDHSNPEVQEFYNQDSVDRLWQYVRGNIRYSEFADRFGPEGERLEGVFETLQDAGADDVATQLRDLLLSIKGDYVGSRFGEPWMQLRQGNSAHNSAARYFDKFAQMWRNAVTATMLQATGIFSTAPEAAAVPTRVGFTRAAGALPKAVVSWLADGINELNIRRQQLMYGEDSRDREGLRRMMHESASLSARSVDSIMRSRVMAGGQTQGEIMRWFFNINMLRPVQRLMRTWVSHAGERHIIDALQNADNDTRLMREVERLGLPTDREARREIVSVVRDMKDGKETAWETEEAQQFLTALERLSRQTVVEGNAASRPLWMNDKNPLMKFAGQFKSFTAAYRSGPLAYMSDETIQNNSGADTIRQSGRLSIALLAMGVAAGMSDWLRHLFYYDLSDPEQREIFRAQKNNIDFGESVRALKRGQWGRAVNQSSGIVPIIERMGILGSATNGVYYPITSTRTYGGNFLIQQMGPGVSMASDVAQATIKGRPSQLFDSAVSILPGGQAMKYREWYKRRIKILTGQIDPPPDPIPADTNGTNTP